VKCALCLLSLLTLAALGWGAPLPYGTGSDQELGVPPDLASLHRRQPPCNIPGRRIPEVTIFSDLSAVSLADRAVPLPQANTLAQVNFQQRRFGRVATEQGSVSFFNPEIVLVKFRGQPLVSALRVEPLREWDAVQALRERADVEFAELDTFERRQFTPNDTQLASQWHHQVIGSFQAWNYGLGQATVCVAIVDSPFQMDHPDLAANTISGWDVDDDQAVISSSGIAHSTLCAGMAAAVINNGIGVAGAANCQILPININGAISEMYDATLWAATNGVRVVNISWSGGTNAVLEAAGLFLKTNASGILVMSAVDGTGLLNGPNQPDVYCVSMTDAADNFQETMYGPYIDFAAPGYEIYSTTTGGSYATASGCSFAAPLVAGVVAWIFGLNPTLEPDDVIGILTNTAVELGPPGWNEYYGWGRVDFGAAAEAAAATRPNISSVQWSTNAVVVTANFRAGLNYSLWRAAQLTPPMWTQATNILLATNGGSIVLTDSSPLPTQAFYLVQASRFAPP
jgi:subtilisin family serine protease